MKLEHNDNDFTTSIKPSATPGVISKTQGPDMVYPDHDEDYQPPIRSPRTVSFLAWIYKKLSAKKILTNNADLRTKLLEGRGFASYFDGLQDDEAYEKFLRLHYLVNDFSDYSIDTERFDTMGNFACSAFKDLLQTRHPDAMHVFRKIQSKMTCEKNLFVWLEEASVKTHPEGVVSGTIHISDLKKFTQMLNCENESLEIQETMKPHDVLRLITDEH